MKETNKTNLIRGKYFISKYLSGRVIDIGCGDDPVHLNVECFDVVHGDANNILAYQKENSYEAVYSSHCLEHMLDVPKTLSNWWRLVKPGGYMIIVVPHEDLYEQGFWPSIFNPDHKATFRLNKDKSWSPVSYNVIDLMNQLPNAEIVSSVIQDNGYEYALKRQGGRDMPYARKILSKIIIIFRQWETIGSLVEKGIYKAVCLLGCPIDQTFGDALAQIEVIVRKRTNIG